MKKDLKDYEKIIEVILVILTAVSLFMNAFLFTNMIYSCSYDTEYLNNLLVSNPFQILLWIDNICIYIFGFVYMICVLQSKKDMLIKISFSIFSMLSTMIVITFAINFIAILFGIY